MRAEGKLTTKAPRHEEVKNKTFVASRLRGNWSDRDDAYPETGTGCVKNSQFSSSLDPRNSSLGKALQRFSIGM